MNAVKAFMCWKKQCPKIYNV